MNQLKMDLQQSIETLTRLKWSQRKIARELGIDRETVARYRRINRVAEVSNPAIPPTGSGSAPQAGQPEKPVTPVESLAPNPAISPVGRRSLCLPLREVIIAKLELGLSAQRIYQDLRSDEHFGGGSDSVKCLRLRGTWRLVGHAQSIREHEFGAVEKPTGV